MSYLPHDPNFKDSFYNMYNPKLWNMLTKSENLKEQLKEKMSTDYEIRENGVAALADYRDDAELLGKRELNIQEGGAIKYYKSGDELVDRLEILLGSKHAGNHSLNLKNEAFDIIDKLFDDREITKVEYIKLYKSFV